MDLLLPLHNNPDSNRLDTSCRETRTDFPPEDRRELEAHQSIEHASCLLRIDHLQVYRARILQSILDGRLGNLVEYYPILLLLAQPKHLRQVPSDSLSLAVLIGCEPYVIRLLSSSSQSGYDALLVVRDLVLRVVVIIHIDSHTLGLEITYVSITGEHGKVFAQKLADRFRLCGRLNDKEMISHVFMLRDYFYLNSGAKVAINSLMCGGTPKIRSQTHQDLPPELSDL